MRRSLLALLACGLSLGVSSSSTAAPPLDSGALLRKFEPVLLFHPEEDWSPEHADAFVGRARVEKQVARGRWTTCRRLPPTNTRGCAFTPLLPLQPPVSAAGRRRLLRGNARRPSPIGRSRSSTAGCSPFRRGARAPPGFTASPRYLVRYWLFYDFDDWRSPRERLWQAHEADWESITIGLSATLQPQFAAYSEHCSGTIRRLERTVTKRGGAHPVDYVALGSHANYFTSSTNSTKFSECLTQVPRPPRASPRQEHRRRSPRSALVDRWARRTRQGPPGLAGHDAARAGRARRAPLPSWASFPGRWSEGQLPLVRRRPRGALTSIMETGGPATPNWNSTSIPSAVLARELEL